MWSPPSVRSGDDLVAGVAAWLCERETESPWIAGATSVALARAFGVDEPELVRTLAAAVADGRLDKRAGWYATPGHVPQLTGEQEALFAALLPAGDNPLVPAEFAPVALDIRRSKVPGIQAAFDVQLGTRAFVRVGAHLYRAAQIVEIRQRLERALDAEGRITAARFRDIVGTSRKYVVPLLEYFDRIGVTARDGDERIRRPSD